ncbi:hypothetical protein [Rhizobium leguminosarum]|uniref:hypothetical protein n=1 Tax=Rhizobium leguminosarum TaxID=384 RepID=UPI002E0FDB2C|nr:hypothetical protein U8Q02_43410 [Rhizobium leguminosarum]
MAEMTFDVAEAIVEKALTVIGRSRSDPKIHLSQKVFGDLMFEALRTTFPKHSLTRVDDLSIDFENGDVKGVKGKATLDRLFNTFEGSNPERIWHRLVSILLEIHKMVSAFENSDALFNPAPDKLVPLLKLRSQVNDWNRESTRLPGMPVGRGQGFLHWPVTGQVVMTVAIDTPDNYTFVTGGHLKTLGIGEDEAKNRAIDNLRAMLAKAKPRTNYRREIVEINGIGGLASSLILLDDFWQQEALKAKDGLAIFAQDWDNLLVCRLGDRDTCRTLAIAAGIRQIKLIFDGAVFIYDHKGMRQATPTELMA